jgi:enoyl-[acyl-carrier protein] reductase III
MKGKQMLTGKIAVVTGASRGIGRAVALRLAQAGADVVINYLRKESAARQVAEEVIALGRRALLIKADVADDDDVARLFDEVRAFGGLDILVANAAIGVMEPLLEVTPKHWQRTLATNAWAFVAMTQQAAPVMRARGGGRIVALTSPGSQRVIEQYGLVGTSKAALEALVRYWAVELAPLGIIVNAVSPGMIETDAIKQLSSPDAILELVRQQTPVGRLATPEDVAGVVEFLCSPQAHMIVGQTLVIDGGYSHLAAKVSL